MECLYESLFIHEMVELENENCCVTPLAPLLIIIIISLSLTLSPPASFTHPSNLNNRRHCLLRRRDDAPHRHIGEMGGKREREKDRHTDKELWQMNKNDIGISLGKPPRHHHLLYEPFLKFKS